MMGERNFTKEEEEEKLEIKENHFQSRGGSAA